MDEQKLQIIREDAHADDLRALDAYRRALRSLVREASRELEAVEDAYNEGEPVNLDERRSLYGIGSSYFASVADAHAKYDSTVRRIRYTEQALKFVLDSE